jgi:hypothetical protein
VWHLFDASVGEGWVGEGSFGRHVRIVMRVVLGALELEREQQSDLTLAHLPRHQHVVRDQGWWGGTRDGEVGPRMVRWWKVSDAALSSRLRRRVKSSHVKSSYVHQARRAVDSSAPAPPAPPPATSSGPRDGKVKTVCAASRATQVKSSRVQSSAVKSSAVKSSYVRERRDKSSRVQSIRVKSSYVRGRRDALRMRRSSIDCVPAILGRSDIMP